MTKNFSHTLLRNPEKKKLICIIRAAYNHQNSLGLTSETFDAWRAQESEIACGEPSLRRTTRSQYRSLCAHYLKLGGHITQSKNTWERTGRIKKSEEKADTHENREALRALIKSEVTLFAGALSDGYVAAIAKNKFKCSDIYSLPASQLAQLLYTVRSRRRSKTTGSK